MTTSLGLHYLVCLNITHVYRADLGGLQIGTEQGANVLCYSCKFTYAYGCQAMKNEAEERSASYYNPAKSYSPAAGP